ncbi:tRNA-dihydrouridine(16) synthase [anaerobic digester metagenome]
MAPFQGITGQVFRACYTKHFSGVDKLFTPYFASINNDKRLPERKLKELSHLNENGIPVIPQILSKEAYEIIRFAKLVGQLGFTEINWNLGCPYPQVANKKRGSGMLPYPALVAEILEKVFIEIKINFSVKCRTGYFSPAEIDDLVPVFNRFPLSELIIHPRIGKQLYSGTADPEKFAHIENQLRMPVVYNGDIFTKNDFDCLQQKFPSVTHWMIGRGLLSDPFLPARIKGLAMPADMKKQFRKFIEDLYLAYRRDTNDSLATIGFMKEYWRYLSESFGDPHKILKKIKKTRNFDEYEEVVSDIFFE